MKVSEIVKFLKAGYTPGDIAKLEDPNSVLELIEGGVEKDQIDDCLSLIDLQIDNGDNSGSAGPDGSDPPQSDPEPAGAGASPASSEPDYKELYNELLKKQQKAAANKDLSGGQQAKPTTEEVLKSLAADFM